MPRQPGPPARRAEAQLYLKLALVAAAVAFAAVALSGLASASSPPTLGVAKQVKVKSANENVAVDSRGAVVYTLSGESVRHLECTKASGCLGVWFPVRATSARAHLRSSPGIRGKLGKLHRDGVFQIALGGHPLYTFLGDAHKPRRASGEGIASFGGVWHVVAAGPKSIGHNPASTTTTSTSSTSPYQY